MFQFRYLESIHKEKNNIECEFMNKNNFNSITVSLTELINRYLPQGVTKKQREFLQICYKLNTDNQESFCVDDFTARGYTTGNYRQYILKLKPILYVVTKTNPVFWALKDVSLPGTKKITHRGVGLGVEMLQNMLEHMKDLPDMIHNIGLNFKSDNLHAILQSNGSTAATSNSLIKLKHFFEELNSDVTFSIYPKYVQVHLGNTYHPIIRDPDGILKLAMVLGHVRQFLKGKSHELANIPLCEDWIVHRYDLNKDGPSCKGKGFEITVSDFDSTLMRFYKKHMDDGTTKNRIEAIQTPSISFNKLFRDTLGLNKKTNITININQDFRTL